MRRWALPTAAVVAIVGLAIVLGPPGQGGPVADQPVERVLVVSLPGVSWRDVQAHDLPHLEAFVDQAAIGDISTRIGRRRASTTDAYLTIGAGTRSLAPDIDVAVALDPDELYGGVSAADILQRRLGSVPDGLAYLAAGAAIDVNDDSGFGGRPGWLGGQLDAAGIERAVIANADATEGFVSDEPPPDGAYARGAVTALMGADGIVPGGTVGRNLLADAPEAAFGRHLDQPVVLDAFDEVWDGAGRSVVLVEASDLSRAAGYSARTTPAQGSELRADALGRSDELLGSLLARTDPARDAVLVVSPVSASATPELALVALRTPSTDGGLLRSSTTRRDGYVQLADVAPTILQLLGEEPPDDVEGRPVEVRDSEASGRMTELVDASSAAGFRDSILVTVVTVVVVALVLLAAAAGWASRRPSRWAAALPPAAYGALGVVPATFVAAQVPGASDSALVFWAAVTAISALLGALSWTSGRRWPGLGPLVSIGLIVAMFALDIALGAPLQVNTVFGYSLAVAGRFVGVGNLAFSLFGAATVVLGALLIDRYGTTAGPAVAGLFVGVVLLEGLPMLGADVGGVVAMVPAFGVTGLILAGHRASGRALAALTVASGLVVMAFAVIDSARPSGQQTHLARLAGHLVSGRWDAFADNLTRRLQASFGSTDAAVWALVVALLAGAGTYVVLAAQGRGPRPVRITHRPAAAAAAGLAVLATLGLVANDSSVAVPATMLVVVTPAVVLHHRQRTTGVLA